MWRLIKAEFEYYINYLIIAGLWALITILVFTLNTSVNQLNLLPLLSSIILFMGILLPLIIGIANDRRNSKRARFYALLLVPVRKSGILYIIFPVCFWLGLVFFFWIIYLISTSGQIDLKYLWRTFAFTGFIFATSASVLFYDLNYWIKNKLSRIILNILGPIFLSGFLLFIVFTILPSVTSTAPYPINHIMFNLGSSPFGSLGILLFGILFMFFGIYIFVGRKSFVE